MNQVVHDPRDNVAIVLWENFADGFYSLSHLVQVLYPGDLLSVLRLYGDLGLGVDVVPDWCE
jgi:hypothetical protein